MISVTIDGNGCPKFECDCETGEYYKSQPLCWSCKEIVAGRLTKLINKKGGK